MSVSVLARCSRGGRSTLTKRQRRLHRFEAFPRQPAVLSQRLLQRWRECLHQCTSGIPKKQKGRKAVCLQSANMSQEGNALNTSTNLEHYVQAELSLQVGTCCVSVSSAKTLRIMFPTRGRIQSEGNESFLASRTFVVGCLPACLYGWTAAGLMVCLFSCVAWCWVRASNRVPRFRGLLLLDEAEWLISPR